MNKLVVLISMLSVLEVSTVATAVGTPNPQWGTVSQICNESVAPRIDVTAAANGVTESLGGGGCVSNVQYITDSSNPNDPKQNFPIILTIHNDHDNKTHLHSIVIGTPRYGAQVWYKSIDNGNGQNSCRVNYSNDHTAFVCSGWTPS